MVEEQLLLEEETPHDEINDNSIIAGLNVTHDIMTENNTTIKTSLLDGFK